MVYCLRLVLLMLMLSSMACTTVTPLGQWQGPAVAAPTTREAWGSGKHQGQVFTSPNYRLYTTVKNPQINERLVQLLEAALIEYRRVAPTVVPVAQAKGGGPMDAYMFATRNEWAAFTQQTLGPAGQIYLQITRGGYTVNQYFVSYYTAEQDSWSVTSHEGFHQFCARHFEGRLPPFIEEGLATTFEEVRWEKVGSNFLPRFNPQVNRLRAQHLRTALETHTEYGLSDLMTLDGGQIVSQPGPRITAFYAQSWAFARFLQEYGNGKYAPKFQQWVQDTVVGTVFDPTGTHRKLTQGWDRYAVKPMLLHYLQTDLNTLQTEFDQWCNYLVHEEFSRQWAN